MPSYDENMSSYSDTSKSTLNSSASVEVRTMEGDDDNDVSTILIDTEQLVSPVVTITIGKTII